MAPVVDSTGKFWFVHLDEAAAQRRSFHAFAEGMHSDVRGQVVSMPAGSEFNLPHDRWPEHLSIVVGIEGTVDAEVDGRTLPLRGLSQLVVLPGVPCSLKAISAATIEWISLRSMPPGKTG